MRGKYSNSLHDLTLGSDDPRKNFVFLYTKIGRRRRKKSEIQNQNQVMKRCPDYFNNYFLNLFILRTFY